MFRIFRDSELQADLERDGFVHLPLLEEDDVARLRGHYREIADLHPPANGPYGVVVSLHIQSLEARRRTMDVVREVVLPRVERHLTDFTPHLAGFWTKLPGPGYLVPHQDWTYVDDARLGDLYWLTLWIALGDYTSADGSLGFVRGSHRFFEGVIASPSKVAATPTRGHDRLLLPYLTFPRLRTGDALAFTTSTIHGSLPNRGAAPRICAGIGLVPRGTELFHYFMKPGSADRILKLSIDETFLLDPDDGKMHQYWQAGLLPEGARVVAELPWAPRLVSAAAIEALCLRHGNVRNEQTVA